MDLMTGLPIWAQAQTATANPNAIGVLALRRWCGSLTLSSPRSAPDFHGPFVLLAGLAVLFGCAIIAQGPAKAFRQLFDLPGHLRLVGIAAQRVRRATGMVAGLIGLMVLSWTGSQSLVFYRESGRTDLIQLTRSRGPGELAAEQGVLAGLTPLRDVGGLADNLPLLIVATILVFRASIEPQRLGAPDARTGMIRGRSRPGWTTAAWGIGALYILYRIVARAAGSPELPYGNCLIVETLLIPLAMATVDGFLLAWVLTEIRNAGLVAAGEGRFDPLEPIALLPGAIVAVALALPARYVAAFVLLANDHLPTSVQTSPIGGYIRWQLGGWGLADLQAAALILVGIVGAVAWTSGRIGEAFEGYGRLLAGEGSRLVAVLAIASLGAGLLSAAAYLVVLLLPAQSWVLNAADSYAHFLTLPVGLWTLAALVELGQRCLPVAVAAQPAPRAADAARDSARTHPALHDPVPPVAAPAP